MNRKFSVVVAVLLALIMALAGCNGNEQQSESSKADGEKTAAEIAEEVGYKLLDEFTAAGYYPLWMQPGSVIIYDERGRAEVISGGELSPEDLVGREDIAATGFSSIGDDEMKIEPNTKAEYDLHGFIQNIYHLWPDGSYNLDYPPENLQSNG